MNDTEPTSFVAHRHGIIASRMRVYNIYCGVRAVLALRQIQLGTRVRIDSRRTALPVDHPFPLL